MKPAEPTPKTDPGPAEVDDDRPPERPVGSPPDDLVESDLLVEGVSIDGMCGVY